ADHRLGDVHRDVLAAVVHGDGVTHHLRDDRGATAPGLDDLLLALLVELVHLLEEVSVHEGALLEAAGHGSLPPAAARPAPAHDELLGRLVGVSGAALGLAPRGDRVAATGGLALATAERVVDGVHGHATGLRAHALPAVAARLADLDQLGLGVADLTDGGPAVDRHPAHLGGGQAQGGPRALLGDQLHRVAGGAAHLGAATGVQLHRVDGGADRDVAQRQRVAGADLRPLARLQHVADLHVAGGQDVALLPVEVVEEHDPAVAV